MAQNLLSIDIRQDIVCALLLAQGAGGASLQRCALSVVVEGNHLEALQEVLQQMGYNGEPCRICLGAETFFYRNLSFPFSDKRKIDKILPIELEDNLPVDVGDVLVDTFVAGKNETESTVVAAMIDRDHLRWQLDELASVGIDPQIVTISGVQTALLMAQKGMHSDFILLDIGCRRANMFVTVDKRMRLIRSMPFDDGSGASFVIDRNSQQVSARKPEELDATFKLLGREMRNALLGLENIELHLPVFLTGALANAKGVQRYLGKNLDCEVRACDYTDIAANINISDGLWRDDLMLSALALSVGPKKKRKGFNFRKDEFAAKMSLSTYRYLFPRIGISLLLCFLAGAAYLWNDFSVRKEELRVTEKRLEQIFTATLPEVTRIVDPVSQLKIEIRELKKGMLGEATLQPDFKVIDMLAEISARTPDSLKVHVVRMVVDQKGILLRGMTDTFKSVDNFKKVLESSDYFSSAEINSANLAAKDSGIRFELKLELNRG